MFANGQFLFFVTLCVANVYASYKGLILPGDYTSGHRYINAKDVMTAQMDYLARGNGYGKDWIVMADGFGKPAVAILKAKKINGTSRISYEKYHIRKPSTPEKEIRFRIYTRLNREQGSVLHQSILESVDFDWWKPTKIIIHGWRSSGDSPVILALKDAYLKTGDANVIIVDWSNMAANLYYPASVQYTKQVGKYVGQIIEKLISKRGAKHENIHLIGHSLGAHIAGIAGYSIKKPIARVTGLDPALPGFSDLGRKEDSLDSSDAHFVDVIHTCAGSLGLSSPIGHADFYPNGGSPFQPGCCCVTELTGVCSHGRSLEYYAESILSNTSFQGVKCQSWKQFTKNSCNNVIVTMGELVSTSSRGAYYLETNSRVPYGRGLAGTKCTKKC